MKKTRQADEQIAFALKQAETGTPVAEVIRRMGISEQTFYRWMNAYVQGPAVDQPLLWYQGAGWPQAQRRSLQADSRGSIVSVSRDGVAITTASYDEYGIPGSTASSIGRFGYGESCEGFIANSGVVSYFGSRDRMTSEYFSALCGVTTM